MELLDEIWRLIFTDYLPLADALQCRRVSKRFKFLIDQLAISELIVYNRSFPYLIYYYKGDQVPSHWIQLYKFNFEPNSSFWIVLENLKHLELSYYLEKEFNLEVFNQFTRLEKLYLEKVIISKSQTIRLPMLKVLSIQIQSERESNCKCRAVLCLINYAKEPHLMLDSKVEKLLCHRMKLLVINHPDCIEYIKCKDFYKPDRTAFKYPQISPTVFKNLRVLHSDLSESMLNIFQNHQNLEELKFTKVLKEDENLFQQLMAERTKLGRNVKVYISDICVSSDRFQEIPVYLYKDSLDFKIQNYHKLADNVDEKMVSYEELINCLNSFTQNQIKLNEWRFPVSFFQKFQCIQSVEVRASNVEEEDRFLWFVSQCNRLNQLLVFAKPLTQSLLNRLPAVCGTVKRLRIYSDISSLDLRPIYGFKQLFELYIYHAKLDKLDSHLDLLELFESCSVYTPDLTIKGPYNILKRERDFKYDDLKSKLPNIIEELKELKKRNSSLSIWGGQ